MIKRWYTEEKLGAEMMSAVKTFRSFWNLEDYWPQGGIYCERNFWRKF